jgi:outer membrane lipoprotein-sorting protein
MTKADRSFSFSAASPPRRAGAMAVALLVAVTFGIGAGADGPATLPATVPSGLDAALWDRMVQVDAKAGKIADLTADFEQQKFTPLMKKPLVSTGTVLAKDSAMLWDTRAPEPTLMRVDEKEVSLFYPKQKTVEIYPIAGQLSSLAASPLPKLAILLRYFRFAPAQAAGVSKEMGEINRPDRLALRLTPIDKELSEHVDNVVVLIDTQRAFILAFQLTDSDQERTVLRFSNVKTNTNLDDARLRFTLPAGVKTVRPLENLGPPPSSSAADKAPK